MPLVWRPHDHRIIALASAHCATRNMIERRAPHTPVQSSVRMQLPHLGGLRHARVLHTSLLRIPRYSIQNQLCESLLSFSHTFQHAAVLNWRQRACNTGVRNSIIQFQDWYKPAWAKDIRGIAVLVLPAAGEQLGKIVGGL